MLFRSHSGLAGIDAKFSPLDLLRSLAEGESRRGSRPAIAESLPAVFLATSSKKAFLIRATAVNATGTTYRLEAVVEISSPVGPLIRTLEWRAPTADPIVSTPKFAPVVAC